MDHDPATHAVADEIKTILTTHGLPDQPFEVADGFANLVVLTPSVVVRLNEDRFPDAFMHEARVLAHLPREIPHPAVIAHGQRAGGGEYLVLERLPGENLQQAWPALSLTERAGIAAQLGGIVRRLHQVPVEDWMRNSWLDKVLADQRWRDAYHAPPSVAASLIASAMVARPDQHDLLARVGVYFATRQSLFGNEMEVFIHTDLHARNILVERGVISGVIDYEGSRPGPPDIELDMLLRSFGSDHADPLPEQVAFMAAFRQAYPDLFASPSLPHRLEVYDALWHLVQLHHWKSGDRWASDPAESLEALLAGAFIGRVARLLETITEARTAPGDGEKETR